MAKEKEKIRCAKCKSTQVYIRIKTQERKCRSCGHTEKIKEK